MGNLSHLDALEAEAIYIIREVAAECEKPVMLYSIGKDSSVMLHLAMKAFYPEKPPFPFLHIDTTWKFKEMIKFRDETAKKLGIEMLTYTNEEGVKQGINPFWITAKSSESYLLHLWLLARKKSHSVIINHDDIAITVYNRSFCCKIKRYNINLLSLDVLPDILLSPVRDRENSHALALVNLSVVKLPHFRTLVLRVPCLCCISERENSLLSS